MPELRQKLSAAGCCSRSRAKCGCGEQFTVPQPDAAAAIPELTDANLAPSDDIPQLTDADLAPTYPTPLAQTVGQNYGQQAPAHQPITQQPQFANAASSRTPRPKWLIPTAISGGVVLVIGIAILVIVLMSGDDDAVAANDSAGNPPALTPPGNVAGANSGGTTPNQSGGSQQPAGNQDGEDAFIASLQRPDWTNTPLDSIPELSAEELRSVSSASYNEVDDAESIVAGLSDENPRKRQSALTSLYWIMTDGEPLTKFRERIVAGVTKNLNDDCPEVREAAAQLCFYLGEDAGPALVPLAVLLRDGTTIGERLAAGEAMAALGEAARPAIALLFQVAMENRDNNVIGNHRCVEGCVMALGNLNCTELVFQLYNSSGFAKRYSLTAMGKLNPCPENALEIMFNGANQDAMFGFAGEAIKGLSHVRPTSDRIMQYFNGIMQNDDEDKRAALMEALVNMDPETPGVRELVMAGLEDDDSSVQYFAEDTARVLGISNNE